MIDKDNRIKEEIEKNVKKGRSVEDEFEVMMKQSYFNEYRFISTSTEKQDKNEHWDKCFVSLKTGDIIFFDIKSVKEKNQRTGNYTIRKSCQEYISEKLETQKNLIKNYFFAFKLYNGSEGSWVIANAIEVLEKCNPINNTEFLYSLEQIKERCRFKIFRSDIPIS